MAKDWRGLVKETFANLRKTNPTAKLSDALKKAGPIWKNMKKSGEGVVSSIQTKVKKMTRRKSKKGKKGKAGKSNKKKTARRRKTRGKK